VLDYLRAIILGIVQAVTEFLPVSSSAHLLFVRKWIGFDAVDGLAFDVAMHVGTLVALVTYFEKDLSSLWTGFKTSFSTPRAGWTADHRLSWYILAATVPAVIVGALLSGAMLEYVRRPLVAVTTLILGGVLFLVAERMSEKSKSMGDLTLGGCLFVGFAQAVALIPGVSRSGIAILAGLALKLKRDEAAKFAFLLAGPIMILAGAKDALVVINLGLTGHQIIVFVVGMLTSAIAGWFVIKYGLMFLRNHRLDVFAYYRFALAGAVILSMVF
jgi:undecaprenyl-diphosphatase